MKLYKEDRGVMMKRRVDASMIECVENSVDCLIKLKSKNNR